MIYRMMHGLPWITNFVTTEAIWKWFSRVTKSQLKIVAESLYEWEKVGIHGNPYIMSFLTRYLMIRSSSQTHQNNNRLLMSPLSPWTVFTDLALWRHHKSLYDVKRKLGTGIVTSYLSIVLARTNWRKCGLHQWIKSCEYRFPATRYSQLCV